mmetsp:Transcript_11962/g.20198  ORF Transcript_11962/g.20198 Transcript_11962/m.20198 type:complete len:186 (+) Transcript_11962:72-629(+)
MARSMELGEFLVPMCCIGNLARVEEILEEGAPVDYLARCGWRPLAAAALAGQTSCAVTLLAHGARIDLPSKNGTALQCALEAGHTEVVKVLLKAGAAADFTQLRECHAHPNCIELIVKHSLEAGVSGTSMAVLQWAAKAGMLPSDCPILGSPDAVAEQSSLGTLAGKPDIRRKIGRASVECSVCC